MSGFDKSIKLEQISIFSLPYANENIDIWKNPIRTQNPLAIHEIIAWDSTSMIFKSKDKSLIRDFKEKYPLSI